MKNYWFSLQLFILSLWLPLTHAIANIHKKQASAEGLGKVAQNMLAPVSVMSDFVQAACFVIGGSFLFASIIKYIEHRRSPLMVPISTVVFLVVAGLALIALPFMTDIIIQQNG